MRALKGGRGPTRKAIVRSRQITGGFPNCTSLLPLRTSAKSGHGDVSTSTGFTVFWKQLATVMIDRNKTTCVFFPVRICEKDKYSKDVNTNNLYSNVQIGCTSIGLHREVSSRFLSNWCTQRSGCERSNSQTIHAFAYCNEITPRNSGYPCICVASRDACCCTMRVSTPTHVALFARICPAYVHMNVYTLTCSITLRAHDATLLVALAASRHSLPKAINLSQRQSQSLRQRQRQSQSLSLSQG